MKYISIFLTSIIVILFSCDNEVDYPKPEFYAKTLQYDSITKVLTGDTVIISSYVSCLYSSLDYFKINLGDNDLSEGFFNESGCTENGFNYFDENLNFIDGVKNIVINYSFIAKDGDNPYSFVFYNHRGESIETETRVIRGIDYHENVCPDIMDMGSNYLYSVKNNALFGNKFLNGKDITDETINIIDIYYCQNTNYKYQLQSPHDPDDRMIHLPQKRAYYDEQYNPKCKRVTVYKKLDDFNFENPTKQDFQSIDFSENNYRVDVNKGDLIGFKTQDNIVGVLEATGRFSAFEFIIKYTE